MSAGSHSKSSAGEEVHANVSTHLPALCAQRQPRACPMLPDIAAAQELLHVEQLPCVTRPLLNHNIQHGPTIIIAAARAADAIKLLNLWRQQVTICLNHMPTKGVQRPSCDVQAMGAHKHALKAPVVVSFRTRGRARLNQRGGARKLQVGD